MTQLRRSIAQAPGGDSRERGKKRASQRQQRWALAHITGRLQEPGQAAMPREIRKAMSYKTRARKRHIRKQLKQQRAANRRLDRFLRPLRDPSAVGLMGPPRSEGG